MDDSESSQTDWRSRLPSRRIIKPSPTPPAGPRPKSEVYERHEKRGVAIIFNQKNFDIPLYSTREGTDKDRDDLQDVLRHLQFDVKTYNDLNYDEIIRVLTMVSKMDHTQHDCLLITIMTHGTLESKLCAKDREFDTGRLWTPFSGIQCPSLAGKPKLFFIKACRGNKIDPGVTLSYTETDSNVEEKLLYSIPVTADVLIMYSTVEGYLSWRNKNGSLFIQSLARQLRNHYQTRHLISILTCVNREVAIGFTSDDPDESPRLNRNIEMCSIVSMLTRDLYLD